MAGANRNLIQNNRIWDNWRYGVLLFSVPAAIRGDNDPAHQQDTSNGNRVISNTMGVGPNGEADLNGADIMYDQGGEGNCFQGNAGAGGKPASSGFGSLPACPGAPTYLPSNPAGPRSSGALCRLGIRRPSTCPRAAIGS